MCPGRNRVWQWGGILLVLLLLASTPFFYDERFLAIVVHHPPRGTARSSSSSFASTFASTTVLKKNTTNNHYQERQEDHSIHHHNDTTTTTTTTTSTSTSTTSTPQTTIGLEPNATRTTSTTTTTTINNQFILSIVVDLTGEMGNMLHHIAHGRGIQLLAHQEYGMKTNMILRLAGTVTKSQQTSKQLRQCFPTLRNMTFLEKSSNNNNNNNNNSNNNKVSLLLEVRQSQQEAMIQELSLQSNLLYMPTGRNVTDVRQSLSYVHNLILQLQQQVQPTQVQQDEYHHHNTTTNNTSTTNTAMAKFASLFATSIQPLYDDGTTAATTAATTTATTATTATATTSTTATTTSSSSSSSSGSSTSPTTLDHHHHHHPIISFPYLHAKSFVNRNFFDLFYDDFRQFFIFDHSTCCAQVPDPDESVFVSSRRTYVFVQVCVCE
jgi:hypothetical protein